MNKASLILSLSSTVLHFSAASVYYKSCSEDITNSVLELGLEYKFLPSLLYNIHQINAYKLGVPGKSALKFSNEYQVLAYEEGVTKIEDALKFSNWPQTRAYMTGITKIDVVLKFTNHYQSDAFKLGINLNDALKFSNWPQVVAYQAGANLEDSLKVTTAWALSALKGGLVPDKAKEFGDYFEERLNQYDDSLRHNLDDFCPYKQLLKVMDAMDDNVSQESLAKIASEFCPGYWG